MRILVEIAYQGNQFLGFQIQQQGRTVQQQFEKILQAEQTGVYMRISNSFISIPN